MYVVKKNEVLVHQFPALQVNTHICIFAGSPEVWSKQITPSPVTSPWIDVEGRVGIAAGLSLLYQ